MPDVSPIQLLIDNVERVGMEWSLSCEEVLGGIGRATLTLQDRDLDYIPPARGDIKVLVRGTGWVLWRGSIIRKPLELPLHLPFRKWRVDCADYNYELQWRLVGALDGETWIDQYGMGFYVNIDPNASSKETDRLTVQSLMDAYIRVGNNEAIETDTYVGTYLANFFPFTWDYSNLQRALEEMAASIAVNLQFWIDPELFFHWVAIPPWQDLAQDQALVAQDDTESTSALMFAEGEIGLLAFAPREAHDIRDELEPDRIGFSSLKIDFDGSDMPEQIYVRGGTGFVYNAPPIPPVEETKTVVKRPTPGTNATYALTFLSTTKVWHTDSTGYISLSYDSVGASGPYNVQWTYVPWNEARHKGGNFWKLLNGPHAGKLVDNDTNVLAGYGSIRVERITTGPGDPEDPKIGVGGSGWTNDTIQDKTLRQAYLDIPLSTDKAKRDAFGSQALYRGSFETLRGSIEVHGIDGWRVGQLLKITDARLPTDLNGKYFIIQRVKSTLIPGNDLRRYTLDFGDGPTSRWSGQNRNKDNVGWPPPAIQIDVKPHDLSPGPDSTQIIVGQLVNGSGEPWAIAGKTVEWSFECYNNLGVLQTGQGSIAPEVSVTDKHGRARTRLTTGPGTNLVYYVFADVKAV